MYHLQRIDEPCQSNNSGAVLVVMENRYIAALFQLPLNLKATGRGNVLQIDSAKGPGQQGHSVDNVIYILASDTERDSVHITKSFEKNAFALHDRHACLRADITQSQHSGAVGNNRHCVPTAGQLITLIHVFLNLKTGGCDTGSIGQGQRVPGVYSGTG